MSRFSSKFDLFDFMSGMGGWFDKDGNLVKDICSGPGVLYSDAMRDFEAFKKSTGGVIHQYIKVKVDEWNQDYVKSHCPGFDFTKHTEVREDKRCKEGKKEYYYYTYTYFNKEYKNLKELNKQGVYVTKDIHFNTILDLIPFFPYIVSAAAKDEDSTTVFISDRSYVDKCFREHNWNGAEQSADYYRHKLAEFTKDIVLKHFADYTERTVNQEFNVEKVDDKYIVHLEKPVDYNFKIELPRAEDISVWSTPKMIDEYTLDVTHTYFDINKRPAIRIKYVHKGERKIWLG